MVHTMRKKGLKPSKTKSRNKIIDEYSGLLKADGTPMSRQQIHMLRKKAKGICLTCDKPALGNYCAEHAVQVRERMRERLQSKRRNWNCLSYGIEEKLLPKATQANLRRARMARAKAAA